MRQIRILFISANRHKEPYPIYPLGTAYLKSYLLKNVPESIVEIADCNLSDNTDLVNRIRTFKPHYIGISFRNVDGANSLDKRGFLPGYKEIVQTVRLASNAPVIIGGSGFSIFPIEFMKELGADYGIQGEGEGPLVQLIMNLEAGGNGSNLPAVLTADKTDYLSHRQYIKNIEAVFEPSLVSYYWKQSGMLNIQTKRGCPNHCIYCSYPVIDGRCVRTMDIPQIVDNIVRIKKEHGADYLFFTDSVFNICNNYNEQLARALIKSNVTISWGAYFSPSNLSEEQMKLYKASGLTHIEFGTESFCDQTLQSYGKQFTFSDILATSNLALKYNVYYAHFLILGGYGEGETELTHTIENSRYLQHTVLFPYIGMRIYPYTPLHKLAVEQGVISAADTLVEPRYYLAKGFDLEKTRAAALATNKAWVFPDDPRNSLVNTLRIKRNKKGPLWEYLRKP
ncbi:MAG: lipid biosynthesis B12-binding/radical SAM protein [Bacteroidales bacterium]